jgi:hypothetical protein
VIWGALIGGFVGTLVLTTVLRAATELRLTRMDLPFLLGTAVSADRVRAKAFGYLLHFAFGLVFAFVYYLVFLAAGRSGVGVGALLGLVHGLFAGSALVSVLLPIVHPRMGTGSDAAGDAPVIEPPGFMLVNYGRQSPAATIVAHVLYGAIVGQLAASASGM